MSNLKFEIQEQGEVVINRVSIIKQTLDIILAVIDCETKNFDVIQFSSCIGKDCVLGMSFQCNEHSIRKDVTKPEGSITTIIFPELKNDWEIFSRWMGNSYVNITFHKWR